MAEMVARSGDTGQMRRGRWHGSEELLEWMRRQQARTVQATELQLTGAAPGAVADQLRRRRLAGDAQAADGGSSD
ncbi:hypothetical protein Scep_025998 [Stephania cephalantha]|uniref:Uncharacterized protein n=1 Tax=Stephania cephalantha TaxID=152367 RepID=A0AAP0HPW6_9MAGN